MVEKLAWLMRKGYTVSISKISAIKGVKYWNLGA